MGSRAEFGAALDPYKQAAVECWTADPCGASESRGELGSKAYFEGLLFARARYAPWMEIALAYDDARNLDVLDVGCGQGIDLARYAMAGARPIGIDITPRHTELTRKHLAVMGLPGTAIISDAEALPFPVRSFDRVSSNGVLHHTPHIASALREIRRVLRPGGQARIILYNRNSFHYWLTQVAYRGILRGQLFRQGSMDRVLSNGVERTRIRGRPLVRVYSPLQTQRLMLDAGFARVSVDAWHFNNEDTPVTKVLAPMVGFLRDRKVLEKIGRIGGWYLVARGFA